MKHIWILATVLATSQVHASPKAWMMRVNDNGTLDTGFNSTGSRDISISAVDQDFSVTDAVLLPGGATAVAIGTRQTSTATVSSMNAIRLSTTTGARAGQWVGNSGICLLGKTGTDVFGVAAVANSSSVTYVVSLVASGSYIVHALPAGGTICTVSGFTPTEVTNSTTADFALPYDLARDSTGRLYVTGIQREPIVGNASFIVRHTKSGSVDSSYGSAGVATVFGSSTSEVEFAQTVALANDGNSVVAGSDSDGGMYYVYNSSGVATGGGGADTNGSFFASSPIPSSNDVMLVGQQGDDAAATFLVRRLFRGGSAWVSTASFAGFTGASARYVAIDNSGKVVVLGRVVNGSTTRLSIARFNADGSIDTSFSGDGKATINLGNASSQSPGGLVIDANNDYFIFGNGDCTSCGAVTM